VVVPEVAQAAVPKVVPAANLENKSYFAETDSLCVEPRDDRTDDLASLS